jgi:hypothetical protein
MSDTNTFYDSVMRLLTAEDKIDATPMYASVNVERGQADAARAIITEMGGVVTGVNPHEAGVTITFEANNYSSDE